jgi:hypothetical protein
MYGQKGGSLVMKSFGKLLLVSAVAVVAIAVSAAPSEAAKKKAAKMAKAPTDCAAIGASCTMAGTGVVHFCAGTKKWTPVLLPKCVGAGCPPACK